MTAVKKLLIGLTVVALVGLTAGFNGCGGQTSGTGAGSSDSSGSKPKTEAKPKEQAKPQAEPQEQPAPGKMVVTLYFSDSNAEKLVAEQRTIRKTPAVASAIIRELMKGPQERDLFPTLPRTMKLLGVKMSGRTAVVNLSQVRKSGIGGTAAEMMIVYSIVDSLTELPNVKNVQFLVDGRRSAYLLDAFDITKPVERDESLIRR